MLSIRVRLSQRLYQSLTIDTGIRPRSQKASGERKVRILTLTSINTSSTTKMRETKRKRKEVEKGDG